MLFLDMADPSNIQEEAFHQRPSVRIVVPDRLKSILVDDWENVTKNMQLVPLPAKLPAAQILDDYFQHESKRRKAGTAEYYILEEVVEGVKDYFNVCLGRVLLYRFEREQYHEMLKQLEDPVGDLAGKKIADIYGGEHLLRLFGTVPTTCCDAILLMLFQVSMPELVAQTNLDQQSVNRLREELSKLTMWLAKDTNVDKYFSTEYENPGQDYIDKARAGVF